MPNSRKYSIKDDILNILKDIQDHPARVHVHRLAPVAVHYVEEALSEPDFSSGEEPATVRALKRYRKNLKIGLNGLDEIFTEIQNREEGIDTEQSMSEGRRRRSRRRSRRRRRSSVGGKRRNGSKKFM